jgi:ABC-2 type transport system permease protein
MSEAQPRPAAPPADRQAEGGSIYDLGYRAYEGPRLGRGAAVWALIVHSTRTAYGLGRTARSKVVPMGLAAFAILPSLLAVGIIALVSQLGDAGEAFEAVSPIRYSTLFPFIAVLVFLFCAAQAPELFGRDQRGGVLPLYFSRAISRVDYAAARVAGLWIALLVLVLVPQLLLLVGRVLAAPDPAAGLGEELPSVPPTIVVGLLIAMLFGSLSAAVAALTPRRSYATVAIIAVMLLPNIVAQLLFELEAGAIAEAAVLLSPPDVLEGLNAFLFDVLPESPPVAAADVDGTVYVVATLAWITGALLVLAQRYRSLDV